MKKVITVIAGLFLLAGMAISTAWALNVVGMPAGGGGNATVEITDVTTTGCTMTFHELGSVEDVKPTNIAIVAQRVDPFKKCMVFTTAPVPSGDVAVSGTMGNWTGGFGKNRTSLKIFFAKPGKYGVGRIKDGTAVVHLKFPEPLKKGDNLVVWVHAVKRDACGNKGWGVYPGYSENPENYGPYFGRNCKGMPQGGFIANPEKSSKGLPLTDEARKVMATLE